MKSDYSSLIVSKNLLEELMRKHHYLSKVSVGFKSGFNVGLIYKGKVVGGCIFTGFPVPELSQSCFGLERDDQDGLWELSRFVLEPEHQSNEHNLATWFMARAIKLLRSKESVRAVLSYADNDHHKGVIYSASNFKYYGLSEKKKDFYIESQQDDLFSGTQMIKHSRGKMKDLEGEWRDRSQKHRFLLVFDKDLNCQWQSQTWK
tara:strand:+ start:447 stop:1058 length:612 start_codon:yes stop_codon:yes gene_type:complete